MERLNIPAPYTSLEEMHEMCASLSARLDAANNGNPDGENVSALSASLDEHLSAYNAARAAFGLPTIGAVPTAPQHAG